MFKLIGTGIASLALITLAGCAASNVADETAPEDSAKRVYPGALDPSFNGGQEVTSTGGFFWSGGVKSDGTIIGAGSINDAVAGVFAFNADGSPQAAWGENGSTTPSEGQGVVASTVAANGNVYGVVPFRPGSETLAVPFILNSQGKQVALGKGVPGNVARQILPQADGSAYLVIRDLDNNKFQLAKFKSNLATDTSFGCTSGKGCNGYSLATDGLSESVAQQGKKLIVAGSVQQGDQLYLKVARYTSRGVIDESFGCAKGDCDGTYVVTKLPGISLNTAPSLSVAVDSDNSIVVAFTTVDASNNTTLRVVRITPNGTSVSQFDTLPGAETVSSQSLVIDPSGRAVVAGTTTNQSGGKAILARWLPDGKIDTSFGCAAAPCSGFANQLPGAAEGVFMSPDGRYVTPGTNGAGTATVAKYLP